MQGQRVAVRLQASGEYSTTVSADVTIGGVSGRFTVTTRAEPGTDTTPDAFTFVSLVDQELDTVVESNTITISGIDAPTPLTVDGPATLIVNGEESTTDTVVNGQRIALRMRSSDAYESTISATLTVGGVLSTFSVTTKSEPPTIVVTNLNDSGPGSLRQAILDAGNGMRIVFGAELSGQLTLTSQVLVDKTVEIYGSGTDVITISGNRQSRLFFVAPAAGVRSIAVTLKHLTLAEGEVREGEDGNGGAILAERGVTLRLQGVVVRDNTADAAGGAIHSRGLVIVENSHLLNNLASGRLGGGGAIHSRGELRITDSLISNNESFHYGGGVYSIGPVAISSTVISANNSAIGAGAIHNHGASLDIVDSFIHSNSSQGSGGAINTFESEVTIRSGTRFHNNVLVGSRPSDGGAIYAYQGSLDISGAEFIGNRTSSSSTARSSGGALYLAEVSSAKIVGSRFNVNTSHRYGGAIQFGPPTTIEILDSDFNGNTSQFGGAVAYSNRKSGDYLIASSTFSNNSAETAGGAFYWNLGVQGQILNSTFTSNTVEGGAGGAIWTNRALTVIESTIARNQASGLGDGIMATSLTLRNSIVALN